jgi:hypothetical protein
MVSVTVIAQNSLYFSTEEDFMGVTPDGAFQIISDGDLLNMDGPVVVKNKDLLMMYDENNDLGLDAVDVVLFEKNIIAFSTELDSTHGLFTAGDLISTVGGVIPNRALLYNWNNLIRNNLGLDAVQFIGKQDMIIDFLFTVSSLPINYFSTNPQELSAYLNRYEIDIWFSTEGTPYPPEKPMFLDGDVLSAKNGTVVVHQFDLIPPPTPAGLPDRGVDYGLDGLLCMRNGDRAFIHFSTEILNYEPLFTDGDLLKFNTPGVVVKNPKLIEKYKSKTQFLGLDAISYFEK